MLDVSINFEQSHWFFPKIIITCLMSLLVIILVKERQTIIKSIQGFSFKSVLNQYNYKAYLFLIIISVYIVGMEMLSEVFPNTGYAFLISTIPFLFVIPFFIEKEITKRKIIFIGLNSILSPVIAWFLLGQLFSITLP